jgi:hypothetical protein
MKHFLRTIKRLPLYGSLGRWRTKSSFEPGYTIALLVPMDMPFLLRLALEGLSGIDSSNCRQILIVPDGWSNDRGQALREVLADFDDPRTEMVELRWIDYRMIRAMRPPGCARTHWMMVVGSTLYARHEYVLLHDADAFFVESNGLERQFREACDRKMDVLGVTTRWDPFFRDRQMDIAGTWEMLFSARWARRRSPMALFPGTWPTQYGEFRFDSTLYAQFLDYPRGTIGVMAKPPKFVHFNTTVFNYRRYRDRGGAAFTDKLFRVLLLSVIESALHVPEAQRTTPSVDVLGAGLGDKSAPVRYDSEANVLGYGEFRTMVERMNGLPVFGGSRAESIRQQLRPFDEHFNYQPHRAHPPAFENKHIRLSGFGE